MKPSTLTERDIENIVDLVSADPVRSIRKRPSGFRLKKASQVHARAVRAAKRKRHWA